MKKSVLVPYERYQQLIQSASRSTDTDNSSEASTQLSPALPPSEAAAPPTSAARQVSLLPMQLQDPLPPPPPASPSVSATEAAAAAASEPNRLHSDIIIACLPKGNRLKAKRLLEFISQQRALDWNRDGNLIVDGQTIHLSHIVDLLHDALNPTKHDPIGADVFYSHLAGIPLSFINNPRRRSSLAGEGRRRQRRKDAFLPPPGLPDGKPKALNAWKAQWKPL